MTKIKLKITVYIPDFDLTYITPWLEGEQAVKADEALTNLGELSSLCLPNKCGGSLILTKAMIDNAIFTVHFAT